MSFLSISNLGKTFIRSRPSAFQSTAESKTVALEDLTFDVAEGEIFTILGPSGCGKTTLLRIIAGLAEPTVGSVTLEGTPIAGPGPDRAIVFQNYPSFPWLNVLDNIAFGLRFSGHSKAHAFRAASRFVELVGLDGFEGAYIRELSGGMQQRVALARSLACGARIVLLDEPFGALDSMMKEQLHHLVLHLRAKEKITILMVTHDINEALSIGDRIAVLTERPARIAEIIAIRERGLNQSIEDDPKKFDLIRSRVGKILRDENQRIR
jgi:NitT/TauT family transport system ATP-binding protein